MTIKTNDKSIPNTGIILGQRLCLAICGNGIPYDKLESLVYGELNKIAKETIIGDWIIMPNGESFIKNFDISHNEEKPLLPDKWLPESFLCESPNGSYQNSPFKSAIIYDLNHGKKPIRQDYYCLEVTCANGGKRYFGFSKKPIIDSFLKVRILADSYSRNDEIIGAWPNAEKQ